MRKQCAVYHVKIEDTWGTGVVPVPGCPVQRTSPPLRSRDLLMVRFNGTRKKNGEMLGQNGRWGGRGGR
jgi:hypothetical protein